MKNFISKLKKIFNLILLIIISIPNKIFAEVLDVSNYTALYGMPNPKPSTITSTIILKIAKICIIPMASLVGIIVYLKKSKSSKKKKITITIISIAIISIITIILYKILENM